MIAELPVESRTPLKRARSWARRTALFLPLAFILTELGLRLAGFGQGALYVSDPDYEYMHAPNQMVHPFGHLVLTNQYGMRSQPLRSGDRVRMLVVGDSVINGGNPTDHESLATTIAEKATSRRLGSPWRVLNISAGSWGPDNVAAFLRRHGLFGARAVVAVFSSHDVGDIMTHEPLVGLSSAFPNKHPWSTTWDVWDRYIQPRLVAVLKPSTTAPPEATIDKFDGRLNPGWRELRDICQGAGIPLIVIVHRELPELRRGELNEQGQTLLRHLEELRIPVVPETGMDSASYRDDIHLNETGQQHLASLLSNIEQSLPQ